MSTIAEVRLWGSTIGAVSLGDNERIASFQYEPKFAESSIELSPVCMPLSKEVYSFPELPFNTFYGLPGLCSDSLPDKFGNAVIDAWLSRQGRKPESLNSIERLCYTGTRGMGALEFFPSTGPDYSRLHKIHIDELVNLASEILLFRNSLQTSFKTEKEGALLEILKVGTSAGGARAKAIIAYNEDTGEVKSGQIEAGSGFKYWIIKFDGVGGNKDKELDDPEGYCEIEFAYYKMASLSGITMSESRLLEENNRRHFLTRRFDRTDNGDKLHMQTLGALGHFDYNNAGAYSYEQAFLIMQELELPMDDKEELFRRMVFNICACNQDDHVKNISFLMDKKGIWRLAPAYDLTFSYNPFGRWTSLHQMSMNGKRDKFMLDDFRECAKVCFMKRGRAESIIEQVQSALKKWPNIALEVKIPEQKINDIRNQFILFL